MSALLPQTVSVAPAASSYVTPHDQGSFRPHPPENGDFGRKPGQAPSHLLADAQCDGVSQVALAVGVAARPSDAEPAATKGERAEVFDQPRPEAGREPSELPAMVREGLTLIDEARPPRSFGGRPRAIDDVAKIKIATLMATGASMRQVAGFLGVSHTTVSAAIAVDAALQQEIDAARQRAVLHPLACIVRESGRNWKAAVWLMDYLNKQTTKELPPTERIRDAAEAKAADWIENDLACEIRQRAQADRLAQQRREEDEQWQREIGARKARKLARAQRDEQPPRATSVPVTSPPRAAPSS